MTPMKMRIKRDMSSRRIDGEMFIVDASRAELHELNGPAAVIWEGLVAGKSAGWIASAIVSEFDTDTKTALADMEAFFKVLRKAGLISSEAGK